MSYISFLPNEIVYIKSIGYATLVNCGARKSIQQKVEALPQKKQSIYFDPDLFNSDADSNNSKKSQGKVEEEKVQKKLIEVISQTKPEQVPTAKVQIAKVQQVVEKEKELNIVQAKLQGGAMIYTSDINLSKTIIIIIKSFLINYKDNIIVQIEISKTIDTLRKSIFQQIGQQIGNYYNIKLFATNPTMTELSVHTKTISQYFIKENDKLMLTAEYAFGFKNITTNSKSKYKTTLTNSSTINSTKVLEEPKLVNPKQTIPLPPPPPIQIKPQVQKTEKPIQTKAQQEKVQLPSIPPLILEQRILQSIPYHAQCNVEFTSGIRYWQLKIEKLPADQDDLIIGVCIPSNDQKQQSNKYDYLWGYQIVSAKKLYIEKDKSTDALQQQSESYGYIVKQNDAIGVLIRFKTKKHVTITFYKNSISCGQAFSIELDSLKSENKVLVPFAHIGGQSQITLDSKAQLPLDSYRTK